MERYDSARFDIARIIGDPFALATISISIVSMPGPSPSAVNRPARMAHRLRQLDNQRCQGAVPQLRLVGAGLPAVDHHHRHHRRRI